MINALIEKFSENYLKYVCIIENLKSQDKEILYISNFSVAFRLIPSNIVMLAGVSDYENAVNAVPNLSSTIFTPDEEFKSLLIDRGLGAIECKQYLYGDQQVESGEVEIKKLSATNENVKLVKENYSLNYTDEQIVNVLSGRFLLGGFIGGEICGFVGMHDELSVGLLQVLPKFKRRGIGSILLKTCVNYCIDNNFVPFCHVRSENFASIELHKKLNCKVYENNVFWF
ncbi:MAG: GNAT family N-acetyltransferase [Clostridia bacterium]|nr:GNAT family N-acetyltransferase [Clostridia bacterium]